MSAITRKEPGNSIWVFAGLDAENMKWTNSLKVVAAIAAALAVAYWAQAYFDSLRLRSGPHAWYVIGRRVDRTSALHGAAQSVLLSGPFGTESECQRSLSKAIGAPLLISCQQLLLSDADRLAR